MSPSLVFLLLFICCIELHYARFVQAPVGNDKPALQTRFALSLSTREPNYRTSNETGGVTTFESVSSPKRVARGAKDGSSKKREPYAVNSYRHPRPHNPDGYFTTPRNSRHVSRGFSNVVLRNASEKGTVFVQNPLYPVTENSYGAYAVMLIALILFAVGIVGNLALMCTVWHNYYLKNAWNSILASLAFCDFLVLFFCLPVVIFNELTTKRLLGDISCRIVPYMEVTSLGVATFSLCALSIDRFHVATSPGPPQLPQVEPCRSILAKLSIVWVGSMVLAAPELLLWQLTQEAARTGAPRPETSVGGAAVHGARTGVPPADACVRQPSAELPESVYALVLTYHEARMWWSFGCYLCLPLLFTAACSLLARHVAAQRSPGKAAGGRVHSSPLSSTSSSSSSSSCSAAPRKRRRQHAGREQRLSATVTALAAVYAACCLPESACSIALAYADLPVSAATEALLSLAGQLLLFARCSATPVLLLCLCRPLGQAFMDCCCCCCEECRAADGAASSCSASTAATPFSPTPPPLPSPAPAAAASPPREEKIRRPAGFGDRGHKEAAVAMVTSC